MITNDGFVIQIKDGPSGWTRTGDLLQVNLPLDRFKELRKIVFDHVMAQGDDWFPGDMISGQAKMAFMGAGIPMDEIERLMQVAETADTGLSHAALMGYAMFSTVRVRISRPETMEDMIAGVKTKWAKPLIGIGEVKAKAMGWFRFKEQAKKEDRRRIIDERGS
jgi:hypothetical protein